MIAGKGGPEKKGSVLSENRLESPHVCRSIRIFVEMVALKGGVVAAKLWGVLKSSLGRVDEKKFGRNKKKNKSLASLKSLAKAEILEERKKGKYPHWQSITFRQVGKEKSFFLRLGVV